MKTVIDEIAEERIRQRRVEGFTSEHDDKYRDGELARAAVCYAAKSTGTSKHRLSRNAAVVVAVGRLMVEAIAPRRGAYQGRSAYRC